MNENGRPTEAGWDKVLPALRRDLEGAAQRDGKGLAAVLSPWLTCEEAFLLAKFIKGLSAEARLYLGPVQVVGEDDTYPKDRKGNPVQPVKFVIRAEKCPNRRGVEEVLRHFQGEVLTFDQLAVADGIHALYLTGGYSPSRGPWLDPDQMNALKKIGLLIVQDIVPGDLAGMAKYALPAASFAEKDGTYVNHGNLAQAIRWAVKPGLGRADGQVFLDLLQRRGLMQVEALRKELAGEIAFFAPLAVGDLGEFGVRLGK